MSAKWVKKLRQIVVCHGDSIELPKYVIKTYSTKCTTDSDYILILFLNHHKSTSPNRQTAVGYDNQSF